jgi:uncharacterized protein
MNQLRPMPAKLDDITPEGELLRRSELNFMRLHSERFRFPALKTAVPQAPGDSIGRAILALTLLSRVLHEKPMHLDEMIARFPEMQNDKGYVGIIPGHAEGIFCEQEIAGHNALLRGLCEYFTLSGDTGIYHAIQSIVTGLIIPSAEALAEYPAVDPDLIMNGEQVALVSLTIGKWRLSTDIACIFLVLDGMTHAYQVVPSPELKNAIEQYIKLFSRMDPVIANAHAHSTISALNGILRFYETSGCVESEYLEIVEKTYVLYKNNAWTENYANYNWFGRPEWTEPCAVIDSFLLTTRLWRLTGKTGYLEDAHLIFYNAFMTGQRPSGGFGCDICAGARENVFIKPHPELFEADCCCTMRGGEGLAKAAEFCFLTDGHVVYFPFYSDCTATLRFDDGLVVLQLTTGYPHKGIIRLHVLGSSSPAVKNLRFYIPSWVDGSSVKVNINGEEGLFSMDDSFLTLSRVLRCNETMLIQFEIQLRSIEAMKHHDMPEYHKFLHGPVVLGANVNHEICLDQTDEFKPLGMGRFLVPDNGEILEPANDMTHLSDDEAKTYCRQILFKNSQRTSHRA